MGNLKYANCVIFKNNRNGIPNITRDCISFRTKHNLTQLKLSIICDVSHSMIEKIESIKNKPHKILRLEKETYKKIASVLYSEFKGVDKVQKEKDSSLSPNAFAKEIERMEKYVFAHQTFEISGVKVEDMKYEPQWHMFKVGDKLCDIYIKWLYFAMIDESYKRKLERDIVMR